jgi:hypothetical protein
MSSIIILRERVRMFNAMLNDSMTIGTGILQDGKRIDPRQIYKDQGPERKCLCCGLPESQVRHD